MKRSGVKAFYLLACEEEVALNRVGREAAVSLGEPVLIWVTRWRSALSLPACHCTEVDNPHDSFSTPVRCCTSKQDHELWNVLSCNWPLYTQLVFANYAQTHSSQLVHHLRRLLR